jgi:hypothetical protein
MFGYANLMKLTAEEMDSEVVPSILKIVFQQLNQVPGFFKLIQIKRKIAFFRCTSHISRAHGHMCMKATIWTAQRHILAM